jgi:hypothetical protein
MKVCKYAVAATLFPAPPCRFFPPGGRQLPPVPKVRPQLPSGDLAIGRVVDRAGHLRADAAAAQCFPDRMLGGADRQRQGGLRAAGQINGLTQLASGVPHATKLHPCVLWRQPN